eukprot:TRINITY_DN7229_c0_g1_i2.p1 TRINITY_DN7229_c0_g1~~TRINITY_DN7229_c0_g1_i2.p1  ORF type:complete len:210 (+),score=21.19 TRINITY_DN7229_c0_g1_i2:43-672(+)
MNSLCWRLTHCVLYLFGGICFLAGSVLYYPYYNTGYSNSFDGFTVGAWIYTIGSLTFLISDVQEWWSLRHGCLGPCKPQSVSSVPLRATSAAVVDHEQQQQQQLEEEDDDILKAAGRPGPRRKRGPVTKPCAAARKRRDRISRHIRTLQGLVPLSTKTDAATVLAQAIRYVRSLEMELAEVKATLAVLTGTAGQQPLQQQQQQQGQMGD